jgi:PAT family beta-lactamase induction signal transducer AmpG
VTQTTSSPAWLRAILNRRMLICVFTGFSSGLPLYLLFSLVPAWLKNGNVDLKVIGVFALAQFPFTWKFLWAPLLDRYNIVPWLGRRRSWMLVMQIVLIAVISWMGQTNISGQGFPWQAFMLAIAVAFLSATLDIALDAFRREILSDEELGLGNAIHVNAYRIAGLVPGSLSLILADKLPWGEVFAITAAFMLPGLIMTLLVKEPAVAKGAPRTLSAAVVDPFKEFFSRHGVKSALLVLLFIFLYKLGDSLCTALATPFYLDTGFSMTEIGIVAKNAGLWASVAGGIFGGIWMIRLGINRALWLFGVVQAVSILGFAYLAWIGPPFVAPQEYVGKTPDAFVRAVTDDVFTTVCANRAILEDNERNARTLVDNSLRRYFNLTRMSTLATAPYSYWEKASEDLNNSKELKKKLANGEIVSEDLKNKILTDGEKASEDLKNSEEVKKKLTDAFHSLLVRHKAASVFQYCDWNVEITTSHFDPKAKDVIVKTVMSRAGAQPISVDYSLEKKLDTSKSPFATLVSFLFPKAKDQEKKEEAPDITKQTWRVFDITVNGQSLVKSYHEIFTEKLRATPAPADPGSLEKAAMKAAIEDLIDWIKKQIETDFWVLFVLALVVGLEALGVGLGSAAFVAFMARTTHPAYVATQLALFTSLMAVPRTFVNASAGWLVEGMGGWLPFFWLCFFLAIPGMLLLFKVAPWGDTPPSPAAASEKGAGGK